jgi:hypothetical protein
VYRMSRAWGGDKVRAERVEGRWTLMRLMDPRPLGSG